MSKWRLRGEAALVRDILKLKYSLYYNIPECYRENVPGAGASAINSDASAVTFRVYEEPRIAIVANNTHQSQATSRAWRAGRSQEYASSFGIGPRNSAPENRDAPPSEQARLHHNCRTRTGFRFRFVSVGDNIAAIIRPCLLEDSGVFVRA